jgi:hypothetical protein
MTLNEWIIYGETGISSKTMWAAITGAVSQELESGYFDIPHDSDDFSRCYKFWKQCNLTREQLNKVKETFNWWAPYIDHWDELAAMYERGCGGMYKYMSTLRNQAYEIKGSKPWKEIAPGVSILCH